jgi:hypothetical protein
MKKNKKIFPNYTTWTFFSLAISLLIGLEVYFIIAREESISVAFATFKYICLITILQIGLLTAARFFGKYFFSGLFAIFLGFNLFGLKLLLIPSLIQLNEKIYWTLFIVVLITLFLFINNLIEKYKITWKTYLLGLIIFGLPAVLQYITNPNISKNNEIIKFEEWGNLNFKDRPNIYLLSFDSLIPNEVATKYLGINEVFYQGVIKEKFQEIPNSLSFKVPTQPSLNSIMRLDQRTQGLNGNLFAGREPSILGQVFRRNNYKINTGYSTNFFGRKGPYIDEYITLGKGVYFEHTTLCIDLGNSIRAKSRLLFLCSVYKNLNKLQNKNKENKLYEKLFNILFSDKSSISLAKEWHERIISYIKRNAKIKQSSLTFFYTYSPVGHTSLDYDHKNLEMKKSYQKYFTEGAQLLANDLNDIFEAIKNNDPNSLVIIFGDHGAWMSRSANENQESEFFYQDRHRILMALMKTDNKCSNPERVYSANYATPSRLLADIFLCLGVDNNSFSRLIDFDDDKRLLDNVFPKIAPINLF